MSRRERSIAVACALAAAAACGSDAPAPAPTKWVRFDLTDGPVNMVVGDFLGLTAFLRDANGNPGPETNEVEIVVRSPSIASLGPGNLLTGVASGSTWVVATSGEMDADSVLVQVREPSGDFRITLVYAADVPQAWRDALESAARRWEDVFDGALEPATLSGTGGDCPTPSGEPASPPLTGIERGVRIYIGQSGQFPPGTYVEAVGGPCLQRPLPAPTTIVGAITINRAHPVSGIPAQRLRYVAVHEMGHTLGLVAVVQGHQPAWFDFGSGRYRGAMALEAQRRLFQAPTVQLMVNTGSHWQMSVPDVMGSPMPAVISSTTVGALFDLGYPARWQGAGPY